MVLNKYLKLKDINIERAYFETMDSVRGLYNELNHVSIVSNLYLILLTRELGDKELVEKYIETKILDETLKSQLKEYIKNKNLEEMKKATEKYSYEMIEAMILFPPVMKYSNIDYSTPVGISKLAIELLNIEANDIVMDLGSGINGFLIQTGIIKKTKELYGIELNTDSYIIGRIRSLILGIDIQMKTGNILSQDFSKIKANKVFSNPPLGQRWRDIKDHIKTNKEMNKYFEETKRTISGEWAFALSALMNTKKHGKTIVLMSNAGMWNKPDEVIRKQLIEEGKIEGVILLPEKLFPTTNISLTMIIFSENNSDIKMVDASEIFAEGRSINTLEDESIKEIIESYNKDSEVSKKVSIKSISEHEYILNPFRYLEGDMHIKDGISLEKITNSINRGSMTRKSELDNIASTKETKYQHLMLSNINDGIIDKELPYLTKLDEKDEKHCIKNNNLIISRIAPFKIALANIDKDKKILATGNLYMIDIDETTANPIYAELFLQSELGMAQLNRYAKGVAMKSISINDLKKIEIPNIPIEEQNKIAEEAKMLAEQLEIHEKQIEMIKDKRDKLIQEVV
ncbi:MAG: N-6 DNA methylase [Peptoniphilaceae bacterium]